MVPLIYADAYWFHELYLRWTVVDWILTLLATGTALSAVIKNSYSVKTGPADFSKTDKFLILLAVLTVIASTFDGKLHAGQLAERYRGGDLILQEAKIDYAASKKGDDDIAALKKRWHDAQSILESSSVAIQKPHGDDTKPSEQVDAKTGNKPTQTVPPAQTPPPIAPKPDTPASVKGMAAVPPAQQ